MTAGPVMRVIVGDSLVELKSLADNSVDSVVTDPPYHLVSIVKRFGAQGAKPALSAAERRFAKTGGGDRKPGTDQYGRLSKGFMGQTWDGGDIAFNVELWAEVYRVLKPGGFVAAFSGTRTYHRMAVAIEDAGFDIRDQLAWVYGSGFPKSLDVSKAIDKAAGAERTVVSSGKAVARMIPGADQNASGWTKDNGREFVPTVTQAATDDAREWEGWGTALKPAWEPICLARKPLSEPTVAANVLKWGTGAINIDGCRIGTDGGTQKSGPPSYKPGTSLQGLVDGSLNGGGCEPIDAGRWPANLIHDGSDEVLAGFPAETGKSTGGRIGNAGGGNVANLPTGQFIAGDPGFGDSGSAARFFYCAKAGKFDRLGSDHPTVKPVELMRWLVRLITPPGGTTLDPFAGSGSTGVAAKLEGMGAVLIELRQEAADDINRRLAHLSGAGGHTAGEKKRSHLKSADNAAKARGDDSPLFAGLD